MVETALRLDRKLFIPHVACLINGGPLEDELRGNDVQVDVFNFKSLFRNVPRNFPPFLRLINFVKAVKPDIVHSYIYWAVVYGTLAANLAKVPVVVGSRRNIDYSRGNRFYLRWLERLADKYTHGITTNSKAVLEDVLQRTNLPPERIHLIYNGCDYSKFSNCKSWGMKTRKEFGFEKDDFVIGILANLHYNKGQEYLLYALPRLLEVRDDSKVIFIGKDRGHEIFLRKVCRNLDIEDKVVFAGERADVPALLSAMDVGVSTSLYSEGFSNAVLEMMAAGLPVVATDVGGNGEAVVHGESGFLVPPRDSAAIAEAIIELMKNPARVTAMGKTARERIKQRFSMDRMVKTLEELYMELLEN